MANRSKTKTDAQDAPDVVIKKPVSKKKVLNTDSIEEIAVSKETVKAKKAAKELVAYDPGLLAIVESKDVPATQKQTILEVISPVLAEITSWQNKVDTINVKSLEDTTSMEIAREARLMVLRKRTALAKDVKTYTDAIKLEMAPYQVQIALWKDIFDFCESMMKNIETTCRAKEETLKNFQKAQDDQLKAEREVLLEPYKMYVPYNTDLVKMSPEDFNKLLALSKLAKEEDDKVLAQQAAEQAENAEKARKLEKVNLRINKVSKIGMTYRERSDDYYYKELSISVKDIEDLSDDEFNTLVSDYDKKIGDIIESEKANQKQMESERRAETLRRCNLFLDCKMLQNGLSWDKSGDGSDYVLIIGYDELYKMGSRELSDFVDDHNDKATKQRSINADNKRREEEDRRLDEEAALVKNSTDKENINRFLNKLEDLKVPEMSSDKGKALKGSIEDMIYKIIKYSEDKMKTW